MGQYIIYKDGAFNIFSTISDSCWFEPALSLTELEEWYKEEYGRSGMEELATRVERSIRHGTSAMNGSTLESNIRAAIRIKAVKSKEEFINKWLTLPSGEGEVGEVDEDAKRTVP